MKATLVMLLLVSLAPGCSCGTVSNAEFDKRYPYGRGTLFTTRGIKEFADRVEQQLGGKARVTALVIYPAYASFTAESQHAGDFDDYMFRDGVFTASPVKNPAKDLALDLFELRSVAIDKVPALLRTCMKDLGLRDGHAQYARIARNIGAPEDNAVVITVHCEEERHSGYVEYDATGKLLKVSER